MYHGIPFEDDYRERLERFQENGARFDFSAIWVTKPRRFVEASEVPSLGNEPEADTCYVAGVLFAKVNPVQSNGGRQPDFPAQTGRDARSDSENSY